MIVKEGDRETELVGNLSHVLDRVRGVVVVLQEVKHTLAFK